MKETITRRELRGMYSALQILCNRFLPTIGSDLKVGELARLIGQIAEPQNAARNKIPLRLMEKEGLTIGELGKLPTLSQQMYMAMLSEMYTEYDEAKVELAVDDRLLVKQSDLPKEKAGEEGWKNGTMNGAIVADLGSLFVHPKTDNEEPKS